MLVVTPCGAKKARKPTFAAELYVGSYFRANLRYALSIAAPADIRILSAKYGLVRPETRLRPYDLRMGEPGSVTPIDVARQAKEQGLLERDVLVLGGRDYVAATESVWRHRVVLTERLKGRMPGLGFGYQIQWLGRHLGQMPP